MFTTKIYLYYYLYNFKKLKNIQWSLYVQLPVFASICFNYRAEPSREAELSHFQLPTADCCSAESGHLQFTKDTAVKYCGLMSFPSLLPLPLLKTLSNFSDSCGLFPVLSTKSRKDRTICFWLAAFMKYVHIKSP